MSAERFLTNPTQLANTLRRMQGFLRLDGVTCYFDSLLEAEALGCTLSWDQYPPVIVGRPTDADASSLQARAQEIASFGRMPVALEVVRRLRVMLGDAVPLVVGITGPFALARQLVLEPDEGRWPELLDLTGKGFLQVAQKFCESGADIVVVEEEPPPATLGISERWQNALASVAKVIRFFEALPVLSIQRETVHERLDALLAAKDEFIVCPAADSITDEDAAALGTAQAYGLALPPAWLEDQQALAVQVERHALKPDAYVTRLVLLTTAGEIPFGWDVKRLPALIGVSRSTLNRR